MRNILEIAASGMEAAERRLAVAADNVANADTPGYTKKSVLLSERAGGGVDVSAIVDTGEAVDVNAEMVDIVKASRSYQAAVKIVDAVDEMMRELLRIGERRGEEDARRCPRCSYVA